MVGRSQPLVRAAPVALADGEPVFESLTVVFLFTCLTFPTC